MVDAVLDLDFLGFDSVFEAEQRIINQQLFHVRRNRSGLQVMDSENIISEADGIRRSEAIIGIIQNLLGCHTEADGIVDIIVQGFLRTGKFLAELDTLCCKLISWREYGKTI